MSPLVSFEGGKYICHPFKGDQRRILPSESVSELEDQLNFKSRDHSERLQPAPESPRAAGRAAEPGLECLWWSCRPRGGSGGWRPGDSPPGAGGVSNPQRLSCCSRSHSGASAKKPGGWEKQAPGFSCNSPASSLPRTHSSTSRVPQTPPPPPLAPSNCLGRQP